MWLGALAALALWGPSREEHLAALGLEKGATGAQIKQAWRKKIVEYHPDKQADRPGGGLAPSVAHEKFVAVHAAYEALQPPQSKSRYTRRARPKARPSTRAEPRRSPPRRSARAEPPEPRPFGPVAPAPCFGLDDDCVHCFGPRPFTPEDTLLPSHVADVEGWAVAPGAVVYGRYVRMTFMTTATGFDSELVPQEEFRSLPRCGGAPAGGCFEVLPATAATRPGDQRLRIKGLERPGYFQAIVAPRGALLSPLAREQCAARSGLLEVPAPSDLPRKAGGSGACRPLGAWQYETSLPTATLTGEAELWPELSALDPLPVEVVARPYHTYRGYGRRDLCGFAPVPSCSAAAAGEACHELRALAAEPGQWPRVEATLRGVAAHLHLEVLVVSTRHGQATKEQLEACAEPADVAAPPVSPSAPECFATGDVALAAQPKRLGPGIGGDAWLGADYCALAPGEPDCSSTRPDSAERCRDKQYVRVLEWQVEADEEGACDGVEAAQWSQVCPLDDAGDGDCQPGCGRTHGCCCERTSTPWDRLSPGDPHGPGPRCACVDLVAGGLSRTAGACASLGLVPAEDEQAQCQH